MSNTHRQKRINKAKKALKNCIEDRTDKRSKIYWGQGEHTVDHEYDNIRNEYGDAVGCAVRHGNNRKYYSITKKKTNRSKRMKAREELREKLEIELMAL